MKWELVTKKIKDLKPHPKNPRKLSQHDYEHLQKSLDKFGLIDKPIINSDGTIIGGHQRIAVLKKSGAKEIECWQPSGAALEQRDMDELNIRLNRNLGEWDWDVLANEWETKDLIEFGFDKIEMHDALITDNHDELDNLDILERFVIEIQCTSEQDQKEKFEQMKSMGYECRLLTL
jgi:ParB-like chromosome segregation protein Spo0J